MPVARASSVHLSHGSQLRHEVVAMIVSAEHSVHIGTLLHGCQHARVQLGREYPFVVQSREVPVPVGLGILGEGDVYEGVRGYGQVSVGPCEGLALGAVPVYLCVRNPSVVPVVGHHGVIVRVHAVQHRFQASSVGRHHSDGHIVQVSAEPGVERCGMGCHGFGHFPAGQFALAFVVSHQVEEGDSHPVERCEQMFEGLLHLVSRHDISRKHH